MEAETTNGGDEKVFGIAFATEPGSSAGVAHILEHSVLCGSERYPCKEPFAVLLRSSMQTFLNAMTYPDRTVYPVASLNERDFRNLVGVYLDAVFRPRLSPYTLMQEGWRLEPAESGGHRFSGVVYSEMKGVYSSADSLHSSACGQALFPGTFYGVSSGGDPAAIPTLSYEQYIAFHRRNYRPEHSKMFFWGDDDVSERLRVADEYLTLGNIHDDPRFAQGAGDALPAGVAPPAGAQCWWPPQAGDGAAAARAATRYSPSPPGESVPVPEDAPSVRFSAPPGGPRRLSVEFPSAGGPTAASAGGEEGAGAEHEEGDGGHFVTVCWALQDGGVRPGAPDFASDAERLGMQVLSALLMGSSEAPLFRALAGSSLGTAVTGGGLSQYLRQGVFEAGLKGVTPDKVAEATGRGPGEVGAAMSDAVEGIVTGVLEAAAADGFKPAHVRSELNKLEFAIREFGAGGSPKGLTLFLGAAGPWIYGRSPVDEMRFDAALVALRAELERDATGFFASLVRRHLLGNSHRVTVHSAPSASLAADLAAAEAAAVRAAVARLGPEQQASLAATAAALQSRQASPDPPEALATVPQLRRADLRRQASPIERHERAAPGATVLACPQASTNGISYLGVTIDIGAALPAELVQWAPLFGELLTSTGTAEEDEEATGHRIGERTGGVSAGVQVSPVPGSRQLARLTLSVGGKALSPRVGELSAVAVDLLRTAPLARRGDILRKHVREGVAGLEGAIAAAGHRHAMLAAGAALSLPGEISYAMGGFPQLRFLRQLRRRLESADEAERRAAEQEAEEALERLRSLSLASAAEHALPLVTVAAGADAIEAAVRAGLDIAAAASLPAGPPADWAVPAPGQQASRGNLVHADAFAPLAAVGLPGGFRSAASGSRLALLVPSSVAYVASAGVGFAHGLPRSACASPSAGLLQPDALAHPTDGSGRLVDFAAPPTAHAAASMLGLGHLWEQVRVQSNAYGAGCSADPVSGVVGFWSYRDPRVRGTLADFASSADWLRSEGGGLDAATIDGTVITAVAGLDKPQSPAERAGQAATRWSLGLSDAQVQARRDELLGMGPEAVEVFAEAVACSQRDAAVCAVVGREMAIAEGIMDASGAALDGWEVIDVFAPERS